MVINMELVFLNKTDLSVLDYGYVEKDFQLVIDSVIPQKSNFNVNKIGINAEVGDLVIVKESSINYIGIIYLRYKSKVEIIFWKLVVISL